GLPLAPRTLLYPVFGERAISGALGDIADAVAAVAVLAGTVGPIGFLGLQVSYGLNALFGLPDTFVTQTVVVACLMGVYLTSAVSGVDRGIQILSRINIVLGAALLLFILFAGPTRLILGSFASGFETHLRYFFDLALYRGDAGPLGSSGWLGSWTLFFWGWFIGYGPLMAIFIARISRGRSIRSIIVVLSLCAPLVTMAWFTILGGAGLGLEIGTPGVVADAMEGFNLPAALLAITQGLPYGFALSVLFLLLTTIFVATTGDSMTYSLSVTLSRSEHPSSLLRVFWGAVMGCMAIVLLAIGSGGIGKLQSFIVVTAVPVSLLLLPTLFSAPSIVLRGAVPAIQPAST
ncbi:MAG: BCCT family transporter, partial [Halieaceae bacterium]|nr:BCCT family transporter [Halieaceae bacterium]